MSEIKKPTKKNSKKNTKKEKKISKSVIKKVEQEATLTRAFQQRYDNKFHMIMYKYNHFPCEECGKDITLNNSSIFADPATGRKFLGLRRVCSTSCTQPEVIYELTPVDPKELKKDNINTFDLF